MAAVLSCAGEMLVSDLARRGAIDGVTVRLPTVAVRAGVPSGAASSFISDIVREVRIPLYAFQTA
jgi:nucleoside-diphosphate-sugar epimerase